MTEANGSERVRSRSCAFGRIPSERTERAPIGAFGRSVRWFTETEEKGNLMSSNQQPQLNPVRFDTLTSTEKIWGLTNIASALGVSTDKARRLSRLDDCPTYRPEPDGSFFAFRSELMAWLKTKGK